MLLSFSRLIGLFLLLAMAPAMAKEAPPCPPAGEFATPARALPQIADAIASGKPVPVLAVGSATTVGDHAEGGQIVSFPQRMLTVLTAALPQAKFDLTVAGKRGLSAEEMLTLLKTALRERRYALVLWQTGTVEAVRRLRPDAFAAALEAGGKAVADAGADLILIDPQFSRFLRSHADLDTYENAIQRAGARDGALLFRRFDLTRAWVLDGRIDPEHAAKTTRIEAATTLNRCVGEVLAAFVLNGAKAAR